MEGYGRLLGGVGVSLDRSVERREKGKRGSRAGGREGRKEREVDRARSPVVREPWFVVKESGGR